nr:DUF6603 domain-containing protein [Nitrosomonas nitrosa]
MTTFIGEVSTGLRCALEPLQNAFSNEVTLRDFFLDFGWDVNVSPAAMASIRAGFAIDAVFDAANAIADRIDEQSEDPALAKALLDAVVKVIDAVKALSSAPPTGLPFPFDQPAFWNEVPSSLGDFLVLRFLQKQAAPLYGVLRLLGIADISSEVSAGGGRVPYKKLAIHWDRLPRVIGDPAALLRDIYRWEGGVQPFDHEKLVSVLEDFFHAVRFPARVQSTGALARRYIDEANPAISQIKELAIPLFSTASNDWSDYVEVGLLILPIPPKGNPEQPPSGILLTPLSSGVIGSNGSSDSIFSLAIKGGFDLDGIFGVEIRPNGLEFFAEPGRATIDSEIAISAHPEQPWILFGDANTSRFEIGSFIAGVGLRGRLDSPEVIISVGTGRGVNPPKLAVVIQMSDGDGFLGNIVGKESIRIDFGGVLVWESRSGKIYFEGSGGFEYAIPLHFNFGIGELNTLIIALRSARNGIGFEAGITAKALFGPLTAVVENLGFKSIFNFASADGKLGDLDVSVDFKPPNGVGLSLDAGVVKGGGYLYFDFDREEYAGVLELAIAKIVTVKAIGLITTKMPDGSKGFSLLIIITAEFGTGIQLGFGFTLIGLGGLLGLNRTMNLQPLMEGVRTGAINSIMFPQNPVANAPRIISDLRTIFPPYPDRFLIGPMAKLGWGTPTLVSVSLGIIIEIPGNIAILGVLKIALPAEDAPLIVIQINFAGAIEFDKKRLYFFASMFESRVLFITIEGEMGLLLAWGDDANFVVSVGGFHPRFNPPPLPFPSPRRIALDILNTAIYRIRAEGYFAVTSNTVQFGSRTELMIDVGVARVEGHIIFDALFQFSPFYFIIEISAGVSLKVFGVGLFSISLQFALEGPTPWRAHGTGTLSLLFFDVSADFDITWGESRDTTLPPIPIIPLLRAELEKFDNWRAELPAGNNLLVSLRKLSATEVTQVLHPLGMLRVSQRAVPLDLKIDKVGNQKPSDANEIKVTPTEGLVKVTDADEQFAKAQFVNMSDADKLSQRAFDPLHGGVVLSSGTQQLGTAKLAKRRVRYEQIIIDNNFKRFQRRFFLFVAGFFGHFLKGAAITKSELSYNFKTQLDPFTEKVKVKAGGFTVAYAENNKPYSSQSTYFASETMATQFIREQVTLRPELHESLHVISQHEANL